MATTTGASQERDPLLVARAAAAAMLGNSTSAATLGIELVDVAPHRATVRMLVRGDLLNGHGTLHGGLIFTLVDSAFAVACNSGNERSVASSAEIDFLRPALPGAVLTATAEVRHRSSRTGIYEGDVINDHGELVALFRGRSHQIGGPVVEEDQ